MLSLPVLKRGSPFWNGIANGYVPILKRGSEFQNGEYWQPRSEMGIMLRFWLLVVRGSKDRKKYSPHSETGSPHSVMGRRQKKSKSGSPRSKKEFVPNWGLTYTHEFLQKYLLDLKDLLLNDTLAYLRRNPVCDIVPNLIQNLIESSLMGKIQDQSVSTYVLDSLSVFTLATGILRVVPFSNNR
jgi:hypothetical protein